MINDGDSILLDASSTAYYLALNLKERSRLRVVTNGIEIARLLAQNTSNTVILIGGVVNPDGSSVTGLLSEQIIAELRIQKAFVSCSGFSVESGMTEVHLEEAQLKRKAIEFARQVFALVDSSKLGHEDLTPFARPAANYALVYRFRNYRGMEAQIATGKHSLYDLRGELGIRRSIITMSENKHSTLLEVRELTRRFPGVLALNQVDFDVHAGEVHALVGENGAGKSTMINILAGVLQPSGGKVLLDGNPIVFHNPG